MLNCLGVRFLSHFRKEAKLSKWPKSWENRTSMDIISSFLAKPVNKHGTVCITLVHTYHLSALGSLGLKTKHLISSGHTDLPQVYFLDTVLKR